MKSRRVLLTLEVLTDAPLPVLRNAFLYRTLAYRDIDGMAWSATVQQAQANVVKPTPKRKRK